MTGFSVPTEAILLPCIARHDFSVQVARPPGRDPNPIEPPTERRPSHLRERQVRAPPQVPMEAGFTPPTEVILLSCIRI